MDAHGGHLYAPPGWEVPHLHRANADRDAGGRVAVFAWDRRNGTPTPNTAVSVGALPISSKHFFTNVQNMNNVDSLYSRPSCG